MASPMISAFPESSTTRACRTLRSLIPTSFAASAWAGTFADPRVLSPSLRVAILDADAIVTSIISWKAIAMLRLSPRQDWCLAKILYKKTQRLVPTRASIHRQRANLLLALARVAARERGLVPARGAREMIEDLQARLQTLK